MGSLLLFEINCASKGGSGCLNIAIIFHKISITLNKGIKILCLILLVSMVVIVLAQVYYRYILVAGIPWAEEIAKKLMVWMALLGAGMIYYNHLHINITFLIDRIQSTKVLKVLKFFSLAVSFVFFLLLIIAGIDYAILGLQFASPVTGIKNFWGNLAIPVGGIILLFHCLSLTIQEIASIKYDYNPTDSSIKEVQKENDD